MKLTPATTITKATPPIAINPATYITTPGRAHVQALWLDRKHGHTVAKAGSLQIDWNTWIWNHKPDQKQNLHTLEELLTLDRLDIYHRTQHIWNGNQLWNRTTPPDEQLHTHLLEFYNNRHQFPVPEGWLGQFIISYENRYNT